MSRRLTVLELRSVRGTGGGPEKTILFGAEQRDRDRFDVLVCYLRDARDDVFGIDARAARLDVDYVEIREAHSFDRRIWPQLKDLVRTRQIDIVHGHDYKTNLLALLLARSCAIVPLTTAHGWTGHSWRERRIYYPMDRRLAAWFPRAIAVSSDIKRQLVDRGADARRVDVILNAIDPDAFRRSADAGAQVRSELGLASGDLLVGAVGRLEPQKRFDLLLDASVDLCRANPHVHLAIVGDGSLRSALQAQIDGLGLGRRLRLLGHRDDIRELHSAFDLFVQASEYEGTPNAVLEAMAMETPLIATDVGGTSEIARPDVDGLIVPAHDVPALARAMTTAVADPAGATRRAASARARVESELSFSRRTRRLEDIYEQIAGARISGPALAPAVGRVPHA